MLRLTAITLAAAVGLAAPAVADPAQSGTVPINGLEVYYEVHGEGGTPLVLLHGGLGSGGMFAAILPALTEGRRVVAVDLQAHGRTADIDRPLSYEAMADDVAGLIEALDLGPADVMGYSLGGGVAIQTAIRHPNAVRRLVAVSAPYARDGWFPEVLSGMDSLGAAAAEAMKPTPMYQHYAAIAPRPEGWPVLLDKVGAMLRQDYDWSAGIVSLQAPTLLVFADADSVSIAHIAGFYRLLGGGQRDAGWDGADRPGNRLAIIPGATHYDVFMAPQLPAAVVPFLDATLPGSL